MLLHQVDDRVCADPCAGPCAGCPDRVVCRCLKVTEETIADAILSLGLRSVRDVRVATGVPEGNYLVFPIGNERVAISLDDCTDPILFDFGPGSDAYFVYTQGRAIPKLRRR